MPAEQLTRIQRMIVGNYSLNESHSCFTQIVGLNTNIRFLDTLAGHDAFQSGDVHTGFIGQHYDDLFRPRLLSDVTLCQAAMALVLTERGEMLQAAADSNGTCHWPELANVESGTNNRSFPLF